MNITGMQRNRKEVSPRKTHTRDGRGRLILPGVDLTRCQRTSGQQLVGDLDGGRINHLVVQLESPGALACRCEVREKRREARRKDNEWRGRRRGFDCASRVPSPKFLRADCEEMDRTGKQDGFAKCANQLNLTVSMSLLHVFWLEGRQWSQHGSIN